MTPGQLATVCRGDVVELADRTRRVIAADGVTCDDGVMVVHSVIGAEWVPTADVAKRIPRGLDHGPYDTGPHTAKDVDG